LFLWDKREIAFLKKTKKNKRTNNYNLSFFCFKRPKKNRRMKSSGDSMVVFMGQKRDSIIYILGERSDPLWLTLLRGSLRSPKIQIIESLFFLFWTTQKESPNDNPSMFNGCFYGIKERLHKMKNIRTNNYNLYNLSFYRPKKNRRMTIHRCSMVVSMG